MYVKISGRAKDAIAKQIGWEVKNGKCIYDLIPHFFTRFKTMDNAGNVPGNFGRSAKVPACYRLRNSARRCGAFVAKQRFASEQDRGQRR